MLKQSYQFCLRQIAVAERDLFRASRRVADSDVAGGKTERETARVFAYLTAGTKFIFLQFLLVFIELAILIVLSPKEGYELFLGSWASKEAQLPFSLSSSRFSLSSPRRRGSSLDSRLHGNDNTGTYELYEKKHKKARWVSLVSFSATVAAVVAVSLVVNLILPLAPSVLGATYTWSQTNWGGGTTAGTAIHPTHQSAWSQYSSASSEITVVNGGEDLELVPHSASSTQTTDANFNGGTFATTTVSGAGSSASVKLTKALHINEYTIGSANGSTAYSVSVTASSVTANSNGTWTVAFSGTPNLARIFKNDKFLDSGSVPWKVLSVAPDVYKIIVVDSEGMMSLGASAPRTGAGTVGRWYTGISAWEAARQGDLVNTRNAIERGLPYYDGAADTASVTIDGWTTDATHYIEIYVPLSERHRGKWDTGKYRLVTTGAWIGGLYILEDNVRVDGLQVESTGTGENNYGIRIAGGGIFWITNCILRSTGASPLTGLSLAGITSGATVHVKNNLIYDWNKGIAADSYGTVMNGTIYNNTIVYCTKGTEPYGMYISNSAAGNNLRFKNNLLNGNTTDYFIQNPEETSNNISEDATSPDTAYRNKTAPFVSTSQSDFHLDFRDGTGNPAMNAGADLSADANLPFTNDIDGDTRSGTWDIGADDVGATLVMTHSIGTTGRDFSTLQEWEDVRDGNLTTRQVFRATQQSAFTEGETVTGATSGATGAYIKAETTPTSSLKGTYDTTGTAYGVAVSGSYAYVADFGGALKVVDVSNPANPTLAGSNNLGGGNAYDIVVSGSYAYIADGTSGLKIVNISSPTSPTLTGTYDTPWVATGVAVSGNYAYVTDYDTGASSTLQIIDISTPSSPTLAGSYPMTNPWDVVISGSYAYVADSGSGLQIINISNPVAPTFSGIYNTPGDANGIYLSGNYAYIADGSSGLQIINISNPAAPTLAGTYNTPGSADDIYVSGNYAYVADYFGGLQIINISSPTAPTFAGIYDTNGTAKGVYVLGGYAYMADGYGLEIIKPLEYFTLDGGSGTFQAGETVVGATSGATSTIGAILTTAGTIEKGEAYKDTTFTAGVTISTGTGSDDTTHDASHYMWLTAEPGSRHTGVAGTGVKIAENGGSDGTNDIIAIINQYTLIEWLEIYQQYSGTGNFDALTYYWPGNIWTARNNIIHGGDGLNSVGVKQGGASTISIYNNIVYNFYTGIFAYANTGFFYNNTVFSNTRGFLRNASAPLIRNNIAVGNSIEDVSNNGGTWSASSSNNITSDATAPGTGSLTNKSVSDLRFVSTASDFVDLHIMDGSVAKDAGADLSATFKSDIDGVALRPNGANFDIGADEWFSSSPVYNSTGTFTSGTIDLGSAVKFTTANFTRTMTSGGIGKAFGANTLGQLGDGTTATTSNAVNISGLTNLVAVEGNNGWVANHFSLGLLADGTVKSWGDNSSGQLGNNTTTNSITPVSVSNISNAIAVAAGSKYSLALLSDGTVKGWGSNDSGQLGDGSTTQRLTPVTVCATGASAGTCDANPLTNVVAIAAGEIFSVALLADGTVKTWGSGYDATIGDGTTAQKSTPTLVSGITNAVAIAAQDRLGGAVLADGTVKVWGLNHYGQLGVNTTTGPDICGSTACSKTPVLVCSTSSTPGVCDSYLSNVVSLAGGDDYFHALLADGTVKAWGNGASARLGDGASTQRLLPVMVCNTGASAGQCDANPLTNVVAIASGEVYSLALLSNGTVKSWGSGGYGVLGNSTPSPYTSTLTPVTVCATGASAGTCDTNPLTGATAIGAGMYHSLIVIGGARFSAAAKTADSGWQDSDYKPLGNQIGMSPTKAVFPTSFSGNRYLRYKAYFSTADSAFSPQLDDLTVNYTYYATNQPTLTSSAYDTADARNILGKIAWTATTTSGNEVRVRVRSSPDNSTWSQWCGYTACNDSDYFATSTNNVDLASSHPLKNGSDDQWLQYKINFISDGAGTPTFGNIVLTYVVNAPPALQSITALQQTSDGKVAISYEVKDVDTATGTTTPGYITPSFLYSIDGGSNWTSITSGYLSADTLTNKAVNGATFTTYTALWDAKSQINGTYATNTKIMVSATDNEGANNTASSESSIFTLDVKNPVATVVVDGTKDGQAGAITTSVTENSSAQMMLSNLSNYSADGLNGSSGTWIATSTSLVWTFASGDPVRVYGKFKDAYQNEVTVAPDAPNMPTTVTIQDISNLNLSEFREFISWNVSTSSDFASYKIYRSTDGSSYSLLSTITSVAVNYLEDGSSGAWLSNGTMYYYKLTASDAVGNISRYSSAVSDIPDGQGGTDVTPPTITGVTVSNILPTQATITWTTDELSNSAVYYSVDSSYSSSKAVASMVTAHTTILTGLTPGTTYNFRARSTDPLSNVSSYATGTPFATTQGPIISGVVVVSASGNSAEIVWNTNANSDSWVIYSLNSDLSGSQTVGTSTLVGGAGPNYEHRVALSSLNTNAKYYFKVRSVDGSSNSAEDNNSGAYYTFSTAQDVSPPIISNVVAALASQTSAAISWTTNELADSQVIYGLDQSSLTSQTAVNSTMTINHSMVLNGLTAGAKYYYKVVSADSSANSTQSAVYDFSTTAQELIKVTQYVESQPADKTTPIISDVSFSDIGETTVSVSWGTDENSGSFVEFGTTEQLGTTIGQFESAKIHRVELKWLSQNTLYYLRSKSPDESGNLGTSKIVSFKTLPAKTAVDQVADIAKNIAKSPDNQKSIEQLTKEVEQMLIDLATKVAPPRITGAEPQVEITSSFATISWITDRPANSMIAFAGERDYLPNSDDPYQISVGDADEQVTEHRVVLSDLAPGTLYHFQVRSKGIVGGVGSSKDFTFRTGEEASISGVEIKEIKKDSATILWRTNIPASSLLEYGLSTAYGSKQSDDAFNVSHIAILRNLNSGTFYHFKIGGTDKNNNAVASPDLTFTTESLPSLLNVKIDAVKEKEIKISWYTDVLADSTAEYTNLKTNRTETFGDKQLVRNHALAVTGLDEDAPYKLNVISKDDKGNEVKSSTYNFQTTRDREAPQITNIQTQSAVSGKDRVQTIVSWKTSEPASSRVIYQEGVVKKSELEKTSPLDNDLKLNHIVVFTDFRPGAVYRLKIESVDGSNNAGESRDLTILTPQRKETVVDLIIKNFQDVFRWTEKMR